MWMRVTRAAVVNLCAVVCGLGVAATVLAGPVAAAPPPTPGMEIDGVKGVCTAGFAAQGHDGAYYLLTSGHCDAGDGSQWTTDQQAPLGQITASEADYDGNDAAILRLDPGAGIPNSRVGGIYPVREVLRGDQVQIGMPFCKMGATTGETCGVVTDVSGGLVEASLFSLGGDSGSPGFVKNPDGTISAVGLLAGSPEGDDYTTYFTLVDPVLAEWGLRILP